MKQILIYYNFEPTNLAKTIKYKTDGKTKPKQPIQPNTIIRSGQIYIFSIVN